MKKPGVAVSQWSNHLDHLVPICRVLDIPVIVMTPELVDVAARFYPQVKVRLESKAESDALTDYEVVFHATRIPRSMLREAGLPPSIRFVHCPHGWSDKAWWIKWMALEDVSLIYGPAQLRMLEEHGTARYLNRSVRSGNFRYEFYRSHQDELDDLIERELGDKLDPALDTILYAPTWNDINASSSFFAACEPLIEKLPARYQLIIKIHPLMDFLSQAKVDELIRGCATRGRVVCLRQFPQIFPLLSRAAIYIGDRSSVGYDYLAFRRPMFFFRPTGQRAGAPEPIDRCGTTIAEDSLQNVYDIIERAVTSDQQKFVAAQEALWNDCFDPPVSESTLSARIEEACRDDRNDADGFEIPPDLLAERQQQVEHVGLQGSARWMRVFTCMSKPV